MKTYRLTLKWEHFNYSVSVMKKGLKNDSDATKWMSLCCDICGKDEHGNKYIFVTLEDMTDETIRLVYAGGN